jgi:acyl carrier protein
MNQTISAREMNQLAIQTLDETIERRQAVLSRIKTILIDRLNLYQSEEQIDDDTLLFGNGLKLDSVDATEVIVMLDAAFGIRVAEGEGVSYMRSINSLADFILWKTAERNALRPEVTAAAAE